MYVSKPLRGARVTAARPGTETKPAVVGKGSGQVTNGEDRRYSRTHDCNLSRPARMVQAAGGVYSSLTMR